MGRSVLLYLFKEAPDNWIVVNMFLEGQSRAQLCVLNAYINLAFLISKKTI